ncbi:hypothetical protein BVRB_032540, partial [Beta vulgaris subsp. vulgaris]
MDPTQIEWMSPHFSYCPEAELAQRSVFHYVDEFRLNADMIQHAPMEIGDSLIATNARNWSQTRPEFNVRQDWTMLSDEAKWTGT